MYYTDTLFHVPVHVSERQVFAASYCNMWSVFNNTIVFLSLHSHQSKSGLKVQCVTISHRIQTNGCSIAQNASLTDNSPNQAALNMCII